MNIEVNAPIVLFVYNRLLQTEQTINALKKNKWAHESDLFIFSDGPKSEKDREKVFAVRDFVKKVQGFKNLTVLENEQNFGLAKSIIRGVTETVSRYGKVIVLEDDLVTSPYFLDYMNHHLALYEEEPKVASIHGYSFPIKNLPDFFFTRGSDCWGWATWKDRWATFEPDSSTLIKRIRKKEIKDFNYGGNYDYYGMLHDQKAGRINSWAIRWHAVTYLNNMLTLNPGKSYVRNIGFGLDSTHCLSGRESFYIKELQEKEIKFTKITIKENKNVRIKIGEFFKKNTRSSLKTKIFKIIPGGLAIKKLLKKN